MNKINASIRAALLAAALISTVSQAGDRERVEVFLAGDLVYFCQDYVEDGDIVLLPVSDTAAALGMDVHADGQSKTLFLRYKLLLITVNEGGEVKWARNSARLDRPPLWKENRIYASSDLFTNVASSVVGKPVTIKKAGQEAEKPSDPEPPVFDTALRNPVDIIMIDPGHGGHESGAKGPGGILEKDVTLVIGKKLRERLGREKNLQVILTREADEHVPLSARPELARVHKADIFVSIHANGFKHVSAQGFETFFASLTATDQAALDLARLENSEDQGGSSAPDAVMDDIQAILGDMAQTEWLADSERLAEMIQSELSRVMNSDNRGVKQAPFRVLMDSSMPAVLIEVGFITCPEEAKAITDPGMQEKIVEAIVSAILSFRDQANSRLGMTPPPK